MSRTKRIATQQRNTAETQIDLAINLDATSPVRIDTGIPFFDHMLNLFAKHSASSIDLQVKGDIEVDFHHTVEDTAIVLGHCIGNALGDKAGITRYGHAYLPMDETLARVVVDLSNRPYLAFRTPRHCPDAPNFPLSLTEEFCRALSANLRCNLHVEVLYGRDGHHVAEAVFKGLARALRQAWSPDALIKGIPSTKEIL